MAQTPRFVIVGGGLAGAKAAEGLRDHGYEGSITLVASEPHLPYERPPLSKAFLAGKDDRASIDVHDRAWYDEHDIDLRLGTAVVDLDRAAHQVQLADGSRLGYDTLLLATGSRSRLLDLPGSDAQGVYYLRTVEDSQRLAEMLGSVERLAVIGAGWIGLEVTANARERGVAVEVIEVAPLPLLGVLGPDLAQMFADLHREHGVTFHFGASVQEVVTEDGAARGVRLGDGTVVPGDAVLIGVGAIANVELARAAGLDVEDGVLVDPLLRTSDPDIYAVGDIAAQEHPVLQRRLRVEHWANAQNQPLAVAATVTGTPTPYDALPFFYTDQYDLGMEYRGHVPRGVEPVVVIRGDRGSRELVAFWLSPEHHVLAGMNVNVWDAGKQIKALILSGKPVDPERLADPGVPLEELC
jgi:3-phenylpropionate/trans-cinnamate dioxygenase ferredoxin reductase component